MEFGTISVSDGISMGHEGMHFSLVSREVIADSVETVIARVINVSAVTCLPAGKTVAQSELGAALRYAAVDKDAVIVAAAGDNPTGRPAQLGRRHVGLDPIVVAALRAVRGVAHRRRTGVGVHHGRPVGGHRRAR